MAEDHMNFMHKSLPAPMYASGGKAETYDSGLFQHSGDSMLGDKMGKKLPETAPNGLEYSDE